MNVTVPAPTSVITPVDEFIVATFDASVVYVIAPELILDGVVVILKDESPTPKVLLDTTMKSELAKPLRPR